MAIKPADDGERREEEQKQEQHLSRRRPAPPGAVHIRYQSSFSGIWFIGSSPFFCSNAIARDIAGQPRLDAQEAQHRHEAPPPEKQPVAGAGHRLRQLLGVVLTLEFEVVVELLEVLEIERRQIRLGFIGANDVVDGFLAGLQGPDAGEVDLVEGAINAPSGCSSPLAI